MAKKYLVSLDLNKNELLNARLQNLSSDPSSPVAGQIYYNTQDNVTKFYDGTQWVSGGSTKYGLLADRPAASKGGTLYVSTDTYTLFLDNGTSWIQVSVNAADLAGVVQSVSGIANQIDVVDTDGDITLSLPSTITVENLTIGNGNGSEIRLEDESGNIVLAANSETLIPSNLTVQYRINGEDLYLGGQTWEQDGHLRIHDAAGNSVFQVNASEEEAELRIHGYMDLYDNGTVRYGNLGWDNATKDFIISAPENNLILQSDSGNAYMNSVSTDNRIITVADLAAVSSGLSWKQAVNLLSVGNIDISTSLTGVAIDGHPALDGTDANYRILLTGQDVDSENGIYVLSWDGVDLTATRSEDADAFAELTGAAVFVMEGSTYGSTSWVQSNHYLTDFTGQDWHQFSGQGTYTADMGVQLVGTEFSVKIDGDSLGSSSNGLYVNLSEGGALNTDGGLYVQVGTGLTINGSNQIVPDTANGYGVRKHAEQIGNGSATSIYVEHGFGTRSVTVQIFETGTPYAQVEADVEHTDTDGVTIKFATAPANSEYEVIIIG